MFKFDQVKSSFDCDLCNKLLVDPVVMACGHFICKVHLDKLLKNPSKEKKTFICGICQEEHSIPNNGFIVNSRLQSLLGLELNTLKASPIFEDCKRGIEEARKNLTDVEFLQENSENYIYEYFEDIKRQVDLRREELKFKIDKYSDDILKSVYNTQINLIKQSKEVNQTRTNIEKSQKEFNELIKQFDTMEFNDKKFEGVKQDVSDVNKEFCKIVDEYNGLLLGNRRYKFQFNELAIEDFFGRFIDFEFNLDSVVLNKKNTLGIYQLCEFPLDKKWKLQYRASQDGFDSENFHSKCDNIAKTLTVIKSTSGSIFGGFTEKAWSSSDSFVTDPTAFVFSLINNDNRPFKIMCSNNGEEAIRCNSTYGPSFGGGDIYIASGSNDNQTSSSIFGYTYQHPDYQTGTEKANSILAGSNNFQTLEIEVFTEVD